MAFDFDKNINTELDSLIPSSNMFKLLVDDFNEQIGLDTGISYNIDSKTLKVTQVMVLPTKCYTKFLKLMLAHKELTKEAIGCVHLFEGIGFYNWLCKPDLSDLNEAFDFAEAFKNTPAFSRILRVNLIVQQIKKLPKKDAISIFDMIQKRYWDNGLYSYIKIDDGIHKEIMKQSKKKYNIPDAINPYAKKKK